MNTDTKTRSHIRILPDKIANQIAAGEVVERPASLLKELIENSLDANAKSIYVAFRNGGKSYIEVVDDGVGLGRDDALLAFEPHATSKIVEVNDLKSVCTLGFRGEALPSIASVSRVTFSASLHGASVGAEVVIEGGKMCDVRDCAPVDGVRIVVRDLFFNTPARRKFMRSQSVEAGQSYEAVARQALARPDVGFKLVRDGKEIINTGGGDGENRLEERIGALFGGSILKELAHVDYTFAGMRISGYVSRPQVTRPSRATQYIYVNGRFVRDRLVSYALMEGFRSMMPKGKFPVAFLYITLAPELVDVNTHPTKIEVRFHDTRGVKTLIMNGIKTALGEMKEGERDEFAGSQVKLNRIDPVASHQSNRPAFAEPVAGFAPPSASAKPFNYHHETSFEEPELKHFDSGISGDFRSVGQIFGSFILLEDRGRLLLLDQHTAHERVLYEKLTKKYNDHKVETQDLLFPMEIELTHEGARVLIAHLQSFEKLGFILEDFGGNTFTLRCVPAILIGKDYKDMITSITDQVSRFDDMTDFSTLAESAINIMACRGAVKANDRLDNREIDALVNSLNDCVMPYTCPHGRPIALTIEKEDILKGFLRK